MNGMNRLMMNNPVFLLKELMVDNVAKATEKQGPVQIAQLNREKEGTFDFAPYDALNKGIDTKKLYLDYFVNAPANDDPLKAYWCPFLGGVGGPLPGWVDVPRSNPKHRLVLTGAMQGCAFVITDSPVSDDRFRVYHHHHPSKGEDVWTAMKKDNPKMNIISIFSETNTELGKDYQKYAVPYDYGNPKLAATMRATNAFNFLWYSDKGEWVYISQSNILSNVFINNRPMGKAVDRDTTMPIWGGPTGIVKSVASVSTSPSGGGGSSSPSTTS